MSENNQLLTNNAGSDKRRHVLEYLFFVLCGVSIIGYYICLILYEYAGFEVPRRITLYSCADVLSWVSIATAAMGVIVVIIKSNLNTTESGNCDEKVHRAYNSYKTINRMLTFTIPPYILALVITRILFAVKPMYIVFIIGGCLSTLVLYSLILLLVYNKKFKSLGIKTALPFITLLFFLIANIASITMFMLDIEGFNIENLKLYFNAYIASIVSTLGFVVCLIISFVKLLKNPKKGNVNPRQLIKAFVILVFAVMSLVVFLIPFGNITPNAITHLGTYTDDDVSISQNVIDDFVSVKMGERPTAMSASFFTLVSLDTCKMFHSYGYKDLITGEIFLDVDKVNTYRYKIRNQGKDTPIQIFFMIDEPISNQFVLVYSFEGITKEYLISANAIR